MSDAFNGGAPAPADSGAPIPAPGDEGFSQAPNPIDVAAQPEPVVAEEPKSKPVSIDDALDRATAKVEAKRAEEPVKPKEKAPEPEAKPETKRDETGKFASDKPAEEPKPEPVKQQDVSPHREPPARFSPDAKSAWEAAPEPVRAETHRAIKEMEAGIEKHRLAAERDDQIREFHDLAKQHGTDVKSVLTQYTTLERTLKADPLRGLEEVCRYAGLSLRDVAAHIMGQTPDQQASQADRTIAELRQELTQIKQQVGTVNQRFQEQDRSSINQTVEQFAAENVRFDELSPTIAKLIETGMADTLKDAYSMAERLSPTQQAAVVTSPAAQAAVPDLSAQTLKGSKSITGAPTSGSDPAKRKRQSSSIDEALDKAFAAAR